MTSKRFLALALLACLFVAGAATLWASGRPDGLERVAEDTGMSRQAEPSAALDLGGMAGMLIVLVLAGGLCWLLRRRDPAVAADNSGERDRT
ncbi:MAG: PDGLE domain-containing protein [Nocardioides sp.]